jgi:hypothetical protein
MYNECRHIFTSGKRCQSPALRDQDFCYFHQSNRRRAASKSRPGEPSAAALPLTPLDDADAIQLAISDVVLALAANRIDPRRARILIYGLQVASQNNKQRSADRNLPTVREALPHADGSLIAPPRQQPDPEDIPKKEVFSLGRILLEEAAALRAEKEAEEAQKTPQQRELEAKQKAPFPTQDDCQPIPLHLPNLHASADTSSQNQSNRCRGYYRVEEREPCPRVPIRFKPNLAGRRRRCLPPTNA